MTRRDRKRNDNARRFDLETLEGRRLMAGNVTASLHFGNLYVTGDANPNSVEIRTEGKFLVVANPGGTINGASTSGVKFALNQFVGSAVVDLNQAARDGSAAPGDSLIVTGLTVPIDLTIDTGGGHDFVSLDRVQVRDDLAIETRGGNDAVFLSNVNVGGFGVDGNRNRAAIVTGDGDDTVSLYRTGIQGELTIVADPTSGIGNDAVQITQSRLGGSMEVWTAGGNDSVNLFGVTVGNSATINTGDGSDSVDIYDSAIGDLLSVDMGAGDYDWLRLFSSRAKRATLLGGTGVNDYLGRNDFVTDDPQSVAGFEQFGQW